MNILGLGCWEEFSKSPAPVEGALGAHDSSAAIVCDGRLVAAAEEERFSRRKHDGDFPLRAIDYCLRQAGIDMAQVDLLAIAEKPFRRGRDSYFAEMDFQDIQRLKAQGRARYRSLVHKRVLDACLRLGFPPFSWGLDPTTAAALALLRERHGRVPPVRYFDHHRAHAAVAYFTSGQDRAAVATIDGRGGPYSTVIWSAAGDRIQRLDSELHPNSLGNFFRDCTLYLGLGEFGEGKTMGLASYGDGSVLDPAVRGLLDMEGESWYRYRTAPNVRALGFAPRRSGEDALRTPYPDFAAACQLALQRAVMRVARSALQATQCGFLCLGGGVALNCSANGALLRSGLADTTWVFPATGDAGLSVGAALLCAEKMGELVREALTHAYWGPEFGPPECEAAVRRRGDLACRRSDAIGDEVAGYLAAGEIVGWFRGRMELGPRALGNRSILADPRTPATRDRVNRLKGRESWRPLAPVVPTGQAADFFDLPCPSPFMLFACPVRPEKRHLVSGVVHVDGTARPQTVTRHQNPALHDLLEHFGRRTGIPVLTNTSFNAAGEPMVCTPDDAVKSFLSMGLDALVLGDLVVRRRS